MRMRRRRRRRRRGVVRDEKEYSDDDDEGIFGRAGFLPRVVPVMCRRPRLDLPQALLHLPSDSDVVREDARVVVPVVTGFVRRPIQVLAHQVRQRFVVFAVERFSLVLW
jgi:hypothetical protein